ncbi:PKD domain-containing protein [Algoriphagus terrigena]|uniref:PKD domain-containing protein n=1 Tax=Algoriphagus terrigena TaxID=344884 RepID=UPI0004789667|nr:PKD domain-containing protein [Algoriphagus terrigena]
MRIKFFAVLSLILIAMTSCKDVLEDITDCVGESAFTTMKHEASASNAREVTFTIAYIGSHTVSSVDWDFGDGSTQNVKGLTVTHTYSAPETANVSANVHLADVCSFEIKKSVTIP